MSTVAPETRPVARPGQAARIAGPIVAVVGSFAVAVLAFGVLQAAGLSEDGAEAVAGFVAACAIVAFGLWLRSRLPAHEQRLVFAAKRPIAVCVATGLGLAVLLRIAAGAIAAAGAELDPGLEDELDRLQDLVPDVGWHKALLAISLVVLAPLGEELLFRGLLLRALTRSLSFPVAAVVSGVVFAVVHPQYWSIWPLIIAISIFGIVAAFVYRRMGYPATVSMHMFFNAAAAVLLFLDVEA